MSDPTAVFADFAEQMAWLIQQTPPAPRTEPEDAKIVEPEKS